VRQGGIWKTTKKFTLGLTLLTIILSSTFTALPVVAKDSTGEESERQFVITGTLHDEFFPEWEDATHWQKESIGVGFTAYGEMVTDQLEGSDYGTGLTYPAHIDEDSGVYPCEHIATPASSGGEWRYYPIEGWQLYWKYKEGGSAHSIDSNWHISMAIYGSNFYPFRRARLNVKPISSTIITNTSRLFVAEVVVHTYNETLLELGFEPENFEIKAVLVFFRNTKKVASYWTIRYLASEAGEIEVVFRRLTDFDIDQKFQGGATECFAVFYPNSNKDSWNGGTSGGDHVFWTGCEYYPQNYSLGVVWTNQSVSMWVPPEGYSVKPQHHVGVIVYYPNCSNWDTDNWNHYMPNLGTTGLFFGEGLGRRYSGQPQSVEYRRIDSTHYAGANLMMGQWNFTLSATAVYRPQRFVTVYTITNCSENFGYVGSPSSYDWDSAIDWTGQRTISELRYWLREFFNPQYKLSSESKDTNNKYLDLSNRYPFSGVSIVNLNSHDGKWDLELEIVYDPTNATVILGDSIEHYGSTLTKASAHSIDSSGAALVGGALGACFNMFDTTAFAEFGTAAPPVYYMTAIAEPEWDPTLLRLTGMKRKTDLWNLTSAGAVTDIFTTPTGSGWDIQHLISVGGPKVNLCTEYFNERTFVIWVSEDSGSELTEEGFYSILTGQFYPADGPYAIISITDDLNLTTWTAIWDGLAGNDYVPGTSDGDTLVLPYAGLSVWGCSGFDTYAACNWLGYYYLNFNSLYTDTYPINERGVTTIILNTEKIEAVYSHTWEWAIQELVGPVDGRYRTERGTGWGSWVYNLNTITW